MSVPHEQLQGPPPAPPNGLEGQSTDAEISGLLADAEASARAETERLTGGASGTEPGQAGATAAAEPGQAFTISELNVQTIAMMLNTAFAIVAEFRQQDLWLLQPEEADRAAKPLAACANKYLANLQLGPEWAAAFEVGQLVLIRTLAERRVLAAKAAGGGK